MKGLEIRIFDLGYLATIGEEIVSGLGNTPFKSPISAVLIRHPEKGYILYDTGNDGAWPDTYPEPIKKTFPVAKFIKITDALKEEGVDANDLDTIILSHLHLDHSGGLKYFQRTEAARNVVVAEAELRDALYQTHLAADGMVGAYSRVHFSALDGVGFKPVSGETEIAEGVRVIEQHTHTAGVLGLEVDLEEAGTVIFTGDAIYTQRSYDKILPPGGSLNAGMAPFRANIEMIKEREKAKNATVLFGHDPDQVAEWSKKGWIR